MKLIKNKNERMFKEYEAVVLNACKKNTDNNKYLTHKQ